MKNYKAEHVDSETFKKKEIETLISVSIVENVKNSLNELGKEFIVTPPIINPEDLSVKFGVMEADRNSSRLKYKISVSLQK